MTFCLLHSHLRSYAFIFYLVCDRICDCGHGHVVWRSKDNFQESVVTFCLAEVGWLFCLCLLLLSVEPVILSRLPSCGKNTKITDDCHHIWLFAWLLGIKPRSSGFAWPVLLFTEPGSRPYLLFSVAGDETQDFSHAM